MPKAPNQPFRYQSAAVSHVGTVRKVNEDACLDRPDIGLWAVADGMGGHAAGDYASRCIINILNETPAPTTASLFLAEVKQRLQSANDQLRSAGRTRGDVIGSTVVTLLAYGEHYACVWAGDSRLYLLRSNEISRISRDHSLVQELIDNQVLSEEEAHYSPHANVVSRAIGAEDDIELDVVHDRIHPGDVFLLCSDGLTKVVTDQEIAKHLQQNGPAVASRSLLELALERGANDNVTAVVVWPVPAEDQTLRPHRMT